MSLLKRDKDAAPADKKKASAVPQVPITAFNFIEADYAIRHSARVRSLIAGGVAAVVITALAGLGLVSRTGLSDTERSAEQAERLERTVREELATALGGVPDLAGHLESRRAEIDAALSHDMSVQQLIADMLAQVPPGVDVFSIKVEAPGAPASTGGREAAPATTDAPADGEPVPPAPAMTASLSVQASGTSHAQAGAWKAALEQIDYLQGLTVQSAADTTGRYTFTLAAAVELTHLQERRAAAAADLGIDTSPAAPAANVPGEES